MSTWTPKDQRRAVRQGWMIGNTEYLGRDIPTVQRIGDPPAHGLSRPDPRFPDDDAAEAYVRGRADAGCALARKALRCSDHAGRTVGRASDWNNLGPSCRAT